jgi:hypothetical protein
MTIADSAGVAVPLSILLVGLSAMFGFMTFRPWPGTSGSVRSASQPISLTAYIYGILKGRPPPAGVAPGDQDVEGIEIGLWALLAAWLFSKLYKPVTSLITPAQIGGGDEGDAEGGDGGGGAVDDGEGAVDDIEGWLETIGVDAVVDI